MSAPRLEVQLGHLRHNAASLVERLAVRGISVAGVTKATLGWPDVARAMLDGGVTSLGESRMENAERLRAAGVTAPILLVRSPMPSQVARVVAATDTSLNSEPAVVARLSAEAVAQGRVHGVVLMIELGDLREGILPADLEAVATDVLARPGIALRGIGTNLACQSGVVPDERNMAQLSAMATSLESALGITLDVVSGGNSANLEWALGSSDVGRVNHLRLGESILLGCEPLHRRPITGLRTDAFTLVAEVIESKAKPSRPWGAVGETAFGLAALAPDRGTRTRALLALGRQDVDPTGLAPPAGMEVLGASSDHLVLDTGDRSLAPGDEVPFGLGYGALLAAMTSPFVATVLREEPVSPAG